MLRSRNTLERFWNGMNPAKCVFRCRELRLMKVSEPSLATQLRGRLLVAPEIDSRT